MAARLEGDTTKIHFHIFTEDLQKIDELFCRQGLRTVGRSKALRLIIHSYLQHLERKSNAKPVPFDASINDIIGGGSK
jgi:hypothetical protein